MYVYGGYISDKAEYLSNILSFNIDQQTWEVVYKGDNSDKDPQGRSNFSMVEYKGNLLIFGGTNGVKTLNDMWNFNLTSKKWEKLECLDTPQPRRGHSMINY